MTLLPTGRLLIGSDPAPLVIVTVPTVVVALLTVSDRVTVPVGSGSGLAEPATETVKFTELPTFNDVGFADTVVVELAAVTLNAAIDALLLT